jgi:Xaa-Pro aminopeptidase
MKEPQHNDYFPLSEYKERLAHLRSEMAKVGMDAILLSTEANVTYCTGFLSGYWFITNYDDSQLALITADTNDEPILFLPDNMEQTARTSCISDVRSWSQFSGGKGKGSVETVSQSFAGRRLTKAKVGLEIGPHDRPGMSLPFLKALQESLPGVEWVDSSEVMKRVRMIKSPLEIEKFRTACNITCQAFKIGLDSLREGMSEREFGQIIALEMSRLSPDVCVNHPWILYVHSDGRGAAAYDGIPSCYRLRKGDTLYLDGGFICQGYPADVLRCAVIGPPTGDQRRYYYASRDANMAALKHVRPGLKCKELYKIWADTVCELGFKDSLKAQRDANWDFLGHGIGLAAHESPIINSTCEEVLAPGMVLALEGNVFDKFPFRDTTISLKNEENVLVTETGYEWLTPLSNDLWIVEK